MFKQWYHRILRATIRWLLPWRIPSTIRILPEVLLNVRQIAASAYPKEFVAFLVGRVVEEDGVQVAVIEGLNIIAYEATVNSTHFRLHDLPTLHGAIGTIHSHPSSNTRYSQADLILFGKFGWVHGIIGKPYRSQDLVFYDKNGKRMSWVSH